MSRYGNNPAVLELDRFGFKGVLRKPFDCHSLRKVLAWVLEPASSE